MKQFEGKVAVVTSGAQGIGKCIAEEFRKEGAQVCVIDIQPGDHFVGDVSQKQVLETFAYDVVTRHGQVDIIVNNAIPIMRGINNCSFEVLGICMQASPSSPSDKVLGRCLKRCTKCGPITLTTYKPKNQ